MKEIIWDGRVQIFTKEQNDQVEEILLSMVCTGRWRPRYLSIMRVFLPDIGELIAQGYVVHHIDGDPSNDHPSNLMVILKGAHRTLHWEQLSPEERVIIGKMDSESLIAYNANLSDERRKELNDINKQSQLIRWANTSTGRRAEIVEVGRIAQQKRRANETDEDRARYCEIQKRAMSNMSPEEVERMGDNISLAKGGHARQGLKFINDVDENFTIAEFAEATGFSYSGADLYLRAALKEDRVILSKKLHDSRRVNSYRRVGQ